MKRGVILGGLSALWLVVLAAGFNALMSYETTPGLASAGTRVWPAQTSLEKDPSAFILVMAAHPRCPCSRASLTELAKLLAQNSTPIRVHVLFYRPRDSGWEPTALWRQAEAMPGVRVHWDEDGVESERFGMGTSGHVMLFDPTGALRFSGGITGARGHLGPCAGQDAVAAALTSDPFEIEPTAVFGCPLTDRACSPSPGATSCPAPR